MWYKTARILMPSLWICHISRVIGFPKLCAMTGPNTGFQFGQWYKCNEFYECHEHNEWSFIYIYIIT